MSSELLGIGATLVLTLVLAVPLGRYLATVYRGDRSWSDFLTPLETGLYRVAGIDPTREMSWQQHLQALLTINLLWFGLGHARALHPGQPAAQPRRQPVHVARPGV